MAGIAEGAAVTEPSHNTLPMGCIKIHGLSFFVCNLAHLIQEVPVNDELIRFLQCLADAAIDGAGHSVVGWDCAKIANLLKGEQAEQPVSQGAKLLLALLMGEQK
jgi:hypothetical protein